MSLVTSVSTRSLPVFGGRRGSSPCRQKHLKCCSCWCAAATSSSVARSCWIRLARHLCRRRKYQLHGFTSQKDPRQRRQGTLHSDRAKTRLPLCRRCAGSLGQRPRGKRGSECRSCDSIRTTKTEDSLALYRNSFARRALCHGFCDLAEFGREKTFATAVTNRNIRTVAVLPLKTSAENESSKSLSLGLTDSLISRLGSLNRGAPAEFRQRLCRSRSGPAKVWRNIKG